MRDLDALALALPGTTKELDKEGRPRYVARRKWFAFHRSPRKDAPFELCFAPLRCAPLSGSRVRAARAC